MESFFAGAFAGLAVDVVLYPLDTIKSRMQAQRPPAIPLRSMYSGIGAVLLQSVPSSAVFFACFDGLRLQIGSVPAAVAAEAMASSVRIPMEVVKQQLQCGSGGHSVASLIKHILKHKGWAGLVQGWRGMLFRDIPFSLLQYPLYILLKSHYDDPRLGRPHWCTDAVFGGLAGGFAAAMTHPWDVCKTRAMVCGEADQPWLLLRELFNRGLLFSGLAQRIVLLAGGGFVYFGAFSIGQRVYGGMFGGRSLSVTPATD